MKKFLIYLMAILGVVSIGFATYYLVEDNEAFYVAKNTIYVTEGEEFDIEYEWVNRKTGSELQVVYDTALLNLVNQGDTSSKFTAQAGGVSTVTFRTGSKDRNVSVKVFVGDGQSSATPFYIDSAAKLRLIGTTEQYSLNKAYKLVDEINLADENGNPTYFTPIGLNSEFVGRFDGNGKTISNFILDPAHYDNNESQNINAGLFDTIGSDGMVMDIKFDNVYIEGYNLGYAGTVAGISYGNIERIEVRGMYASPTNVTALGGIVGLMETLEQGSVENNDYTRLNSRVDRVSANVVFGQTIVYDEELQANTIVYTGVSGNVGGLVGENYAGIIVYSYAKGSVYLNDATVNYGGIVGYNSYKEFTTTANNKYYINQPTIVGNTYAAINLYTVTARENVNLHIGGIIGYNNDTLATIESAESRINRIIGNYYDLTRHSQTVELIPDGEGGYTEYVKNYVYGVGYNIKDGIASVLNDEEYFVLGYGSDELKLQSTYLSHVEIERVYESELSTEYTEKETAVTWQFGYIWNIASNLNEGYPYLDYTNKEVEYPFQNVLDSVTISNEEQLLQALQQLDGSYIIIANLDMSYFEDGWTPIGTLTNPFVGSLQAASYINEKGEKEYFTVFNLTLDGTELTENTYGGLFGVTSGTMGGTIKNMVFNNAQITGYKYAGAVAGTNGYKVTQMTTGNTSTYVGLTINNVAVVGSSISGTNAVGGIVGVNYGVITGAQVNDYVYTLPASEIPTYVNSTITLIPALADSTVGGLVGTNYGTIAQSKVVGGSAIYATSSTILIVKAGGIVGYNTTTGQLNRVVIESINGVTGVNVSGYFGGITGHNSGVITQAYVQSQIVAPTIYTDEQSVYLYDATGVIVGGIAGVVDQFGSIYYSQVNESSIDGYKAGGIVGILDTESQIDYTFDENGNISQDNTIAISQVGVNDTTINGKYAGGLAATIKNGILSDVYIIGSVSGTDENSVKAGMVAEIQYEKLSENLPISAGVIQRAYSSVSFSGQGQGYSVSKSDFINTTIVSGFAERRGGFITNYIFDSSKSKDTINIEKTIAEQVWIWFKNYVVNPVGNFFGAGWENTPGNAVATEDMVGSSVYRDFNFSTSIWNFNTEEMPTLISLDNLETIALSSYVKIYTSSVYEISSASTLTSDIEFVGMNITKSFSYTYIQNGKDFKFEIISNPEYVISNIVVEANGLVITPDVQGFYTISNIFDTVIITISYDI